MQDVAVGYERSKWGAQLSPFFRLGDSFAPLLARLAQLKLPSAASQSSLDAFLVSEVAFAQQLVTTIATDLTSLSHLVLGSGILTPPLQVCSIPNIVCPVMTVTVSVMTCVSLLQSKKKPVTQGLSGQVIRTTAKLALHASTFAIVHA